MIEERDEILEKLEIAETKYIDSFKLFGTTDDYNTQNSERLHTDFVKDAYRATNHKDEFPQIRRLRSVPLAAYRGGRSSPSETGITRCASIFSTYTSHLATSTCPDTAFDVIVTVVPHQDQDREVAQRARCPL